MKILKTKDSFFDVLKNKIKTIIKHPLFSFILTGAVFLLILILSKNKVISGRHFRAIGQSLIYYVVALGFMILLGYAGLASLGTAGFIGLGAYVLGYFATNQLNEGMDFVFQGLGLPVFVAVILAVLIALIVGIVVGFISLRIRGMYLAIITLGLSEILKEIFGTAWSVTNGDFGLSLEGVKIFGLALDRNNSFFLLVVVMVLLMIAVWNLINSPSGRAMLSMKNSPSAAQAMGMSLVKYRLLAFVIATIFAVIGGTFYILFYEFTRPAEWNLNLSLNILAAVVVGGSKSMFGILFGTFIIFGLDDIILKQIPFFAANGSASLIVSGVLIILVIVFYPGGLIRLGKDIKVGIIKLYHKIKEKHRKKVYGSDDEYNETKEEYIIQQRKKAGI